jgi:hypothetical protein
MVFINGSPNVPRDSIPKFICLRMFGVEPDEFEASFVENVPAVNLPMKPSIPEDLRSFFSFPNKLEHKLYTIVPSGGFVKIHIGKVSQV